MTRQGRRNGEARAAAPFGDGLTTIDDAVARLARFDALPGVETRGLADASGRILAGDIATALPIAPYESAAMDGFAFRFADLVSGRRMPVAGRVMAGHPLTMPLPPGTAARIFTGGLIPDGADTVAVQEECVVGAGSVLLPPMIAQGANLRLPGEDAPQGSVVLAAGVRLRPQHIGMAAAAGHRELAVRCRPRVAVLSTGDELRLPGEPLAAGCRYDSNRYAIAAALRGLGASVTDMGILPDEPASICAALSHAAEAQDLLISIGGASEGEEDHILPALRRIGSIDFWKLALKPGKPLVAGTVAETPFIGLPGNPVAAMITFWLVVRPLLLHLMSAAPTPDPRLPVVADFRHRRRPGYREYLRVRVRHDGDGRLRAKKYPSTSSALLSSLVWSNGLAEISEDKGDVEIGDRLDFLPYDALLG